MAGRLLDEDPEAAYAHAVAARDRAGRVAAVREAAGLAAYLTGRYAEALAELRAARRMSGDQSTLPVMADCERGLGRPEKALAMASSPEVATLDAAGRAEMLIVASGARRDMGQPDAAALLLQGPELQPGRRRAWSARLFYAYAEALLAAGREDEAVVWFGHAADADETGETDADERLAELAGVVVIEHDDEDRRRHDADRRDDRRGARPRRLSRRRPQAGRPARRPQIARGRAGRRPCRRDPREVGSAARRAARRTGRDRQHQRQRPAPRQRGAPGGAPGRRAGPPRAAQRRRAGVLPAGGLPAARPQAAQTERSPTVDTLDCAAWRRDVQRSLARLQPGDVLEVHGSLRRRFWRAGPAAASRSEVEVTRVRRVAAA